MILHELTQKQVEALIKSPSHAILITGPKGIGKRSVADHLVGQILQIKDLENHPYGKIITPQDDKMIGIETVRELEHFLSLKVPGQAQTNRFIIFEDAHLLTTEAQNALLKTLEEPPQGSIIIMTAAHEQALLPTIRSRVQSLKVASPPILVLEGYFTDQGHAPADVKKTIMMSGGLPGLTHALLTDQTHPLTQATDYARQLLSKTPYERLLMVDELTKNKQLTLDTCFILQQMARISLQNAAKKWQNILEAAYNAAEQLQQSAQPKLVLDNLMLHL